MCEQRQFSLLGIISVVMPQGYIAGGGTPPNEGNDKVLKEAEPKIVKIAETMRDKLVLPKEQQGEAVMSKVLNPIMYSMMISAKGFSVTDKCTGCSKYADHYPLNNMKFENCKPSWGKNYTHCMAYIAVCPT